MMFRLILQMAVAAFGLLVLGVIFVAMFPAVSQQTRPTPIPESHFFRDVQTDCEYIRGGTGSYTPRMEGVGMDYRHRGCRQ